MKRAWLWAKRLGLWFLAFFRLSNYAICEMSRDRGYCDSFHSWPDDVEGFPDHSRLLRCKRCGKSFTI